MSKDGFVNRYLDNANKFYSTALKQFKFYKKIEGCKVIVSRISKDSKYKSVFGSIYSSTMVDDDEREEFPYVVVFNMNDMKKIFQKSIEQMDFYDNEDVLKLGDVITYARKGQEYKFKIVDVQSFSEAEGVLNRYTVTGMIETNALL